MKIDLMNDIIFPTISVRELAKNEELPKKHNWVNIMGKTYVFEFNGAQGILEEKIDEMLEPLKKIVQYQLYNRQVGHTTTMLEGAANNKKVSILVGNNMQGEHIRRKLVKDHGWTIGDAKEAVITLHQLKDLSFGIDRPLILDNVAYFEMLNHMSPGLVAKMEERRGKINE